MLAKMKDNLIERYERCMPGELAATDPLDREYVKAFLSWIEGEVVELVFTGDDAFEKNDNNIWLHDDLWEQI